MIYSLFLCLIFLGSVFLTSEKFVDTETAIKFYFTVLVVLVGIIVLSVKHKNLRSEVQKLTSLSVLKGLFFVGVLQAIYGILQYIGKYPSNHNAFAVTGSFENPAGFIAVLSLLFPIGIYWCIRIKGLEQGLIFIATGLILFSIILSGSRTGIIGAIISILIVLVVEFQLLSRIKNLKYSKLIMLSAIIVLLVGLFILYKWREGSANGRLLIWRVSTEMIQDKPLGYGHKGFQANYMDYQARYFTANPQSGFRQLADNVKHPFNEFIKIAVNYGIIGLFTYLALLSVILWKILKTQSSIQVILLAIYATFIVLSCFSYPLQYAPVWFLLVYFTLVLFSNSVPSKRLSLPGKILITGTCIAGIVFFFLKLSNEIKWKAIAVKSLQGQTEQMLPQYQKLYPHLKRNAFFLYNYGAELNVAKHYKKSIAILNECQEQFNDYDLQMLLADNYYHNGDTTKSIQSYQYAANMIPCRFLPLYWQFEIYKETGKANQVAAIAREIVGKEVKVSSNTVSTIIQRAIDYLTEQEKE